MNNLIVLPMVLPILVGILLVFLQKHLLLQRLFSFMILIANSVISLYLLHNIQTKGIMRLDFGEWEPPFGILFVADSFAMLLVLSTSVVSAIVLLYSMYATEEQIEKRYFYSFILFLIAGVNGSFLTGDLFNLFVAFEVMLVSSYILIVIGGKRRQFVSSITYVTINIISSSFFLIGIAYIYGTVGTLNMAHLSERIGEVGQTPILTVISIIFLLVFSLKAGLFLYQWLPRSYSAPPTVIAALFGALLTKVGIYALFRTFTLLFYHEEQITHTLITILAIVTLVGGSIGAIAYTDLRQIVAYNVIISVGFILIGLAVMTPEAMEGSIFYIIHDMIVKALLFLVIGTTIYLTGRSQMSRLSGLIKNYPVLGWIFFLTILSLVGIPPLSGFVGKILIGQGAIKAESYVLLFVGFASSLFVLYSLLRVFMNCFWGETLISPEDEKPLRKGLIMPSLLLAILTIALGMGAETVAIYITDAAETLLNPQIYIDAVLK
ncbi:MAG TPA: Na+/H+ antiporter subunit D [Bacillota bacterium]|nr:Na+/H+ antiporter subunit D [Bacillota bacterium]